MNNYAISIGQYTVDRSVLADSHASFIYGKTLEYMTDALESTPVGVYGGGCSLDDFA